MGASRSPVSGPPKPQRIPNEVRQGEAEKGSKSESEWIHRNKPPNTRTNTKKGREAGPEDAQMRSLTLRGGHHSREASTLSNLNAQDVAPVEEKASVDNSNAIDSDGSESSAEWEGRSEDGERAPTASAKNASAPASATSPAEDPTPTHQCPANEPDFKPKDSGTDVQSPMAWTQDEQRSSRPTEPARESHPPASRSAFTSSQDEELARVPSLIDLTDLDKPNSGTALSLQRGGPQMFAHARAKIFGGKFVNIYEFDSPALGSGSAFPIAVLGLQTVSFATRSHYPHCNYPLEAAPVVATPSTVYISLHFPSLEREMKIMIAPLTLWFFLKMWIQQRANGRH